MNIKQKTQELEETFQNMGWDSLAFEIDNYELKIMIRDYCERNGISEVISK